MKQKVGIVSLGCPRNLVDSEHLLGRLKHKDYSLVDIDKARVAIVNTCAFIEDAKKESIDVLLELIERKKQGQLDKIIVYGCLAQRYAEQLRREMPEIDAFVGALALSGQDRRVAITERHYAYLKICEGCVNQCSFCVIPAIKGELRSQSASVIAAQARQFDRQRLSELNIIGQDITGYGMERSGRSQLAGLLKKVYALTPHIPWIRLLYLHPQRITDELLSLVADSPRICKYVDIPLQHCSDRILKAMNRGMGKAGLIKLIEKIRRRIPQVALRTSVIVGFPTETEDEFQELLDFIRQMEFERLGAFVYSREEGTRAYALKPQVPDKVKQARFDAVMSLQQEVSARVNQRLLGKRMQVLIDETGPDGVIGRTQFDAPEVDGSVYVESKRNLVPGELVTVRITDTLEYDLRGVHEP